MVVMETSTASLHRRGIAIRDVDVSKKVLEAIQVVHSAGYVLGDVRPPNVMIGEVDEVKLIDFNWAGEWTEGDGSDGAVRYPAYMSQGIWTDGIKPMEKINKNPYIDMPAKWLSPNSPCKY